MMRVVVHGEKLRGYSKWLLHEHNESRGRQMVTWRVYEVPEDIGAEMLAKGAVIDTPEGEG